jgi:hypothetical protein
LARSHLQASRLDISSSVLLLALECRLLLDAKRILTEAISTDTRFLAAQSVMDYSLLLGLEKGKKELVVGIVDSIGSYDLWKTIESKGKMLTRGGDVTVVSPLVSLPELG